LASRKMALLFGRMVMSLHHLIPSIYGEYGGQKKEVFLLVKTNKGVDPHSQKELRHR